MQRLHGGPGDLWRPQLHLLHPLQGQSLLLSLPLRSSNHRRTSPLLLPFRPLPRHTKSVCATWPLHLSGKTLKRMRAGGPSGKRGQLAAQQPQRAQTTKVELKERAEGELREARLQTKLPLRLDRVSAVRENRCGVRAAGRPAAARAMVLTLLASVPSEAAAPSRRTVLVLVLAMRQVQLHAAAAGV